MIKTFALPKRTGNRHPLVRLKMPFILSCSLFLVVSCKQVVTTKSFDCRDFTCVYPENWKVVVSEDEKFDSSIEFDFPGPGFASVSVYHPENQSAFDIYTANTAQRFPEIHEAEYPAQKVTILQDRIATKLGSLDAVKTSFSIYIEPRDVEVAFTYLNLTSPDSVMIIDIFDEGTPLSERLESTLEELVDSIQMKE